MNDKKFLIAIRHCCSVVKVQRENLMLQFTITVQK